MGGTRPARNVGPTCKDCSAAPLPDGRRCEVCKATHNARERARREERKRKRLCRVCGEKAAKDEAGNVLSTCGTHREYYRARVAG
jgi:hypothetical protein